MASPKVQHGYFGNIVYAAKSVLDGMSVTLSHLARRPMTIQYPDKVGTRVADLLPDRYRGFLEVDMDICTACKLCEVACPIDVIVIDIEGKGKERYMSRFDIDMAKCMYCGLCVEPCPTGAIRMTKEFEASTPDPATLIFRFIQPGVHAPPYKVKKGEERPPTRQKGDIARESMEDGLRLNLGWIHAARGKMKERRDSPQPAEHKAMAADATWLADVEKKVAELKTKFEPKDSKVLFSEIREVLADTDCGACDWPTCDEYATALSDGRDLDHTKCEPGGQVTTDQVDVILKVWRGQPVIVGSIVSAVQKAQAQPAEPAPTAV